MEIDKTNRSAAQLVEALADADARVPAYFELVNFFGREAVPAIRDGLRHDSWEVRKWSAMYLDHHADESALADLIPLLDDPHNEVRLWAVHSISCDSCKEGCNPVDVVPLLIERIERDQSIRVRRMATAMLSEREPDLRAVPALERILKTEKNRKLRLHAERALQHYQEAGLVA
jgi:HEAT repeat protein